MVHIGDDPCEFFVKLRRVPRRRLRLPALFASAMELDPPETLRLHMRGCGISGTRVRIAFPAPNVMYLDRGWKTFARIHSLMEGDLLSVKAFGCFGTRAKCCVDSSSDSEGSPSSESDKEGSNSDDEGSRR